MANYLKFVLRTDRKNKDGLHPIRLRITKNGVKYISVNIWGDPQYWSEENEVFIILKGVKGEANKKLNEAHKYTNALLGKLKANGLSVISEFDSDNIDWTLNQFENAFLNRGKKGKVYDYITNTIRTLKETNHIGNSICYANTLRLLELFDNKFKTKLFSEIDIKFVIAFDVFLQKRGCKGNTRKYYMKSLRAILNKAIKENEATAKTYPFGKGGFEISKLEEVTEKRYLPAEYLTKLKNTPSDISENEYARKLFLFSYYCYGISFIDMALLQNKNVIKLNDGDYIVYKRQKIKTQKNVRFIQIKITDEILTLINDLVGFMDPIDNYLLPIITISGYSGEQLYNHIRGRYRKYNNYLDKLAKEMDLKNINLTSYVSRHTMAMTLQNNNISREVISQILGHNDLETTNTYLDSFNSNVIDEAAKVL